MSALTRFNRGTESFLFWSTWLCTGIFFMIIIVSVIARYLVRSSLLNSVELSRLFFVWACFLAAALCFRRKSHIAIHFFVEKMPERMRGITGILTGFLTIVFLSVLLFHSAMVVYELRLTLFPLTGISQSWLYLPVPLVSFIMFFYCLEEILRKC